MGQAVRKLEESGGISCLLIEDSNFDQRHIVRMLHAAGRVDLAIAATLEEARKELARSTFDLILMDNALPDGLGVDFALELRKIDRYRDLPILIASDFPSPFMFDKAMAARVRRVLTKSELRPRHIRDLWREDRE